MKNFSFELDIIKSKSIVSAGDRIVVGYASTYDIDSDFTQLTREALQKASEDLLTYSTVLYNHDDTRPIGVVIETAVDDIGLLVKVKISKDETEIWNKVTEGIINKFSIRGRSGDFEYITKGEDTILQIKSVSLHEVSLVSVPANKEAKTICYYIAKSLDINSFEDVKKSLIQLTDMNTIISRLKSIESKIEDEDLKKQINDFVIRFEKENDVLASLKLLAGKLDTEDRMSLEQAIEMMSKRYDCENEEAEEIEETRYSLDDDSDDRPVYQLNTNEETEIELVDGHPNRFRKQILKFGKWYHWNSDGGVLDISSDVIDSIIKNFKKSYIENVSVPLTHTSDPSKNTGEVVALEKTDDGLDAILEIKDESTAEKIKKGLIKCISASFDPNYLVKKSKKFVGPTLLHAALVAEPYIKGMGEFVSLADDFSDRKIIQLEDEKPNYKSLYNSLIKKQEEMGNITKDELKEMFVEIIKANEIQKQAELEKKLDSVEVINGMRGKYIKENEQIIFKAFTAEENIEFAKSKYNECVGEEMKSGKSMAEASKSCKMKVKKDLDFDIPEEGEGDQPKPESENKEIEVDLAEVNQKYEQLLKEGKIVPAQKDAFISLFKSSKTVELADGSNKVELSKTLFEFFDNQPKIINFDENGTSVGDPEPKPVVEEIPQDVKEFYGKMNMSEEAMKDAWKLAKELDKEEKENSESKIFE